MTFKIITLAASIEENIVNLFEDEYYDTGSIQVENARLRCWKAGGHGHQTFLNVVENSCNPGFVVLGQKLGKEKLFKYINSFGFGNKTNIDLNGEGSGILFKLDKVGPVELATTSFGQGVSVTPIQQVTAISAAINGGTLLKPYVVKRFLEPEVNSVVKEFKSIEIRRVISEDTSNLVRFALESVVANGTGRPAFIDGYRVGGKTGTAQKVKDGIYMIGNYIVSFIGFMPADSPKIALYVAIDNPKGVVQYGGTVAGPIARNIFKDVINALNIEKRADGMEKEYMFYDKKYIEVPEVIGMNLKDAKEKLKNFEIQYSGVGSIILEQSPNGGERLLEGSKVRVLLGD